MIKISACVTGPDGQANTLPTFYPIYGMDEKIKRLPPELYEWIASWSSPQKEEDNTNVVIQLIEMRFDGSLNNLGPIDLAVDDKRLRIDFEKQIISFVAVCDGCPDDQLSTNPHDPSRIHTYGIIQDASPSEALTFCKRLSRRMHRSQLGHWSGKDAKYRRRFAEALRHELVETGGRVHIYEASEAEIIASEPVIRQIIPQSVGYRVHEIGGTPIQITASGHTSNLRCGIRTSPQSEWRVGVLVPWITMAITDFYSVVALQCEIEHNQHPKMLLLVDRFKDDDIDCPGSMSLLHAILNGMLGDRLLHQYAGERGSDNAAEMVIDNIVGLFNERHTSPTTEASRIVTGMIEEEDCRRHLKVIRYDPDAFTELLKLQERKSHTG